MRLGVRGGVIPAFLGILMVLETSLGFLVAEVGMSRVCLGPVGTALAGRGERQYVAASSIVGKGGKRGVGVDEVSTPTVDSPLFRRFGNLKGKNVKTVSESIEDFCKLYTKPILPQFRTTVNEILVINHLYKVNARFQYSPVYAYGLNSTFFKLLSLYPGEGVLKQILSAIVQSINLDLEQFHKDVAKVENWMETSMTVESLTDNLKGKGKGPIADTVRAAKDDEFYLYTKPFTWAVIAFMEKLNMDLEPDAIVNLTRETNFNSDAVKNDLDQYKETMENVAQANRHFRETAMREKTKAAKRLEEKAQKILMQAKEVTAGAEADVSEPKDLP